MQILTKYLGKTVIGTITLVIFALLSLEIFIELTREFPDLGTGFYGLLQMFAYIPMLLPSDIYHLFPMAGMLGCLIGLGILASHSELIVMRTAGMSLGDITITVLKAALLITIFMTILGEVIAPKLQYIGDRYKMEALNSKQALLTNSGVWIRNNKDFIHIEKVLPKGQMENITRYVFDDQNRLIATSFAKNANFDKTSNQWIFQNIDQTNLFDKSTTSSHFVQQNWNLSLKPKLLGLGSFDSEQKSLIELKNYINFRKQSGLDTSQYEFTFWQRVFQPLATLVMIIIAVPFIFGPLRTATMGLRIVAGALVGFSFHIINQFVGPMSMVWDFPPIIAAVLPSMLFALFGCILIIRAK